MPHVDFSNEHSRFLPLGTVNLTLETEPADVIVRDCCVSLNPKPGAVDSPCWGFNCPAYPDGFPTLITLLFDDPWGDYEPFHYEGSWVDPDPFEPENPRYEHHMTATSFSPDLSGLQRLEFYHRPFTCEWWGGAITRKEIWRLYTEEEVGETTVTSVTEDITEAVYTDHQAYNAWADNDPYRESPFEGGAGAASVYTHGWLWRCRLFTNVQSLPRFAINVFPFNSTTFIHEIVQLRSWPNEYADGFTETNMFTGYLGQPSHPDGYWWTSENHATYTGPPYLPKKNYGSGLTNGMFNVGKTAEESFPACVPGKNSWQMKVYVNATEIDAMIDPGTIPNGGTLYIPQPSLEAE